MRLVELPDIYIEDGTPILASSVSAVSKEYQIHLTLYVEKGALILVRPLGVGTQPDLTKVIAMFQLVGALTYENFGKAVNAYVQGCYSEWQEEKEGYNPNWRNQRRGPRSGDLR